MISKCVHCLKENIEVTSDHVFPSSWYLSTSSELIKLTAPSCRECNNKLGKIEESLLRIFSFGVSPKSPGHEDIYERTKRSMSKSAGRSQKDRDIRKIIQNNFFKEILPAKQFPETAIINPDKVEITSESLGKLLCLEELNMFLTKIAKGIVYNFSRVKYITDTYLFTHVHFQPADNALEHIPCYEKSYGQSFSFRFWECITFSPSGIIEILIWSRFYFSVFIENKNLIANEETI